MIFVKALFLMIALFLTRSNQLKAVTVVEEFASPVTTEAAPLFLAGTLMSTFMYLKQKDVSYAPTYQASKDRPLKKTSLIGDYYGQLIPNALYILVMGTHAMATNSNKSAYRAEHMFKATLYASIVVTALKYTIREPRPNNPEEKNSFPSGHTTTAFAFASTMAMQHDVVVGTTALLMAGFTAYSRMNDGRHYLHDVVAGMTIGIGYGVGIYHSQRGHARFAMFPIIDKDTVGVSVVKAF